MVNHFSFFYQENHMSRKDKMTHNIMPDDGHLKSNDTQHAIEDPLGY